MATSGLIENLGTRARVIWDVARGQVRSNSTHALPPFRAIKRGNVLSCQPALFEPEQLERVRSCAFSRTLASETEKLMETSFRERPREQAELGPCIVAGGRVLSDAESYFLSQQPAWKAARGHMRDFDRLDIASSYHGLKYFGHWLRDDCPLYESIRDDGTACFMRGPNWPDQLLYKAAFEHNAEEISFARAENLVLHTEQGFSLGKARRIRILRDRLRRKHRPRHSGHIVYLSRGVEPNQRDMDNRAEFEDGLRAQGVHIVHPNHDPEHLVQEMLDARIVITVEGSQATHGTYTLADDGAILILQTPHRFYNPHHEWARLLGVHYGTVVGRATNQSYHMDLGEVLQMIDRLTAVQAKSAANAL